MFPRPAPIDADEVLTFCKEVEPAAEPAVVRRLSIAGEAEKNCFPIVNRQVTESGGRFVLGWAIWEHPGVMLEAELHAVWEHPEGRLIDITPRPEPFDGITFLPDKCGLRYDRQVDNKRKPLSSDPRILRFIELLNERFELLNEGALADVFGKIQLTPTAHARYQRIDRELMELAHFIFGSVSGKNH